MAITNRVKKSYSRYVDSEKPINVVQFAGREVERSSVAIAGVTAVFRLEFVIERGNHFLIDSQSSFENLENILIYYLETFSLFSFCLVQTYKKIMPDADLALNVKFNILSDRAYYSSISKLEKIEWKNWRPKN